MSRKQKDKKAKPSESSMQYVSHRIIEQALVNDPVNHPPHYTSHPSGVECITVTEHMPFNVGTAVKYLWRAGIKDPAATIEDLQKAEWYVRREIERLQKGLH